VAARVPWCFHPSFRRLPDIHPIQKLREHGRLGIYWRAAPANPRKSKSLIGYPLGRAAALNV
jgi:hypothetical protein